MEDRDVKKTFVIPKTYASNKDVLINEKIDSRNVTEIFADLKSSALNSHFDFRQKFCKSCDLIRNPKLQKFYTEKRLKMRKEQEPNERFAYHYVSHREIALKIATNGVQCGQLTLPMEKYLGNSNEGVHLSKRPDVLLTSTGAQGLSKFGLIVFKVLLGKGFPTMPSITNNQFAAQLHFDHHFPKSSANQSETKTFDDLLAASLIFCYEHENFQPISHPTQILPLAVLWFELEEKFPLETNSPTIQKRRIPSSKVHNGSWEEPKAIEPLKLTSQFLIPFHRVESNNVVQTRDPRLMKKTNETIPLSPQRSISENGLTAKMSNKMSTSSIVKIPLSSLIPLADPRVVSLTPNRTVVFLENHAVKHYFQQQKRSNSHHDVKTNYTLIPFRLRQVSLEEFEQISIDSTSLTAKSLKNSPKVDCSSLFVSVVDCFTFGFSTGANRSFIDLDQTENRIAFEQMEKSNELIERERQINSQHIRLRLREKRQRKFQQHLNEKRLEQTKFVSKSRLIEARQILKEFPLSSSLPNKIVSSELIEFFSREYQNENRSHVKHLFAELVAVLIEKYPLEEQRQHSNVNVEVASPSPQTFVDRDERFHLPTAPIQLETNVEPLKETKIESFSPIDETKTTSIEIDDKEEKEEEEEDRSRDELVRLLAKKVSSTRTVTLVSDRSINEKSNEDEEPMAKRRKIDERSSKFKSRISSTKESRKNEENVDVRRRSTNRRGGESPQMKKFSRDSTERSRTHSKSSLNGRRTSPSAPNSNYKRRSTTTSSDRHRHLDSFSSSSYSSTVSHSSHKLFNYNHQSVADHPRFANHNVLPPPLMSLERPYVSFDSFRSRHETRTRKSSRNHYENEPPAPLRMVPRLHN